MATIDCLFQRADKNVPAFKSHKFPYRAEFHVDNSFVLARHHQNELMSVLTESLGPPRPWGPLHMYRTGSWTTSPMTAALDVWRGSRFVIYLRNRSAVNELKAVLIEAKLTGRFDEL